MTDNVVNVMIIDQTTRESVRENLISVERKPTTTDAYFISDGHYKVLTSNGISICMGPVWILWDTLDYPYPITEEEFNKIYIIKDKG
jgi:hypothetical protein